MDFLDLQALGPGVGQPLFRALEVVINVALAADEGAHLRARGIAVDVVVLHALRRLERPHALDERGPGDAQSMVLGSWQSMQATGCVTSLPPRVGHLVHLLEALDEVAVAHSCRQVHRRVAMQAGARLFRHLLAPGVGLVVEHVGVAALLAVVHAKRRIPPTCCLRRGSSSSFGSG